MKDGRTSRLAKDILPSLKPKSQRTVWQEPELQYDGKEPPKAWLARLRQLKQIHGYNERETLKIAKKCLKGDAELWCRIHQPQSFSSLRTGLHTRFASGPVSSVVKPSLPVPQSEYQFSEFLLDVPVPLSSKFVTPSRLSNQETSPVKLLHGERLGSVRFVSPSKLFSTERPASVRSLNKPKCLGFERSLSVRSVIPSTQLAGERSVSGWSMNPLNGENSTSGKLVTDKERSSVPAALSESNMSTKVTCKLESGKQPVAFSSYPKTTAAYRNEEDRQCLVVPGLKVGPAKGTSETGRASDKSTGSRKKELDTDTLGSDLLQQTSKSMETVEANSSNENMDPFLLFSMNYSASAKDILDNDGKNNLPHSCRSLPINWQQTLLQFKRAIHSAMKGDWKYISADFCNFYLQCYGMRTSGSRSEKIHRIRDHLELTDGSGAQKYPRNSFVVDCPGDVCVGDVIFFEQRLRQGYDVISGNLFDNIKRITVGRVVKDSKGSGSEQVFTIEVYWSKGPHAFRPMRPVCIRAGDLHRLKPRRQVWMNEEARKQMLEEKKNSNLEKGVASAPMLKNSGTKT